MKDLSQQPLLDHAAEQAEIARYRKLIAQLPVTLRPALNGELAEWPTLFAYERQRMQELMRGVASFRATELAALMEPLRRVEEKMGVSHWSNFSENADTMENASLLARSADYAEWRTQVSRVYSAVLDAAHASLPPPVLSPRIVLVILPVSLPYARAGLWDKWSGKGVEVAIDGDPARLPELLLRGNPSLPGLITSESAGQPSDMWLIDAASGLTSLSPGPDAALLLSDAALRPLREQVLEQLNTIPKNIADADQTIAGIRNANWDAYWPAELAGHPPLRRFVLDLYLSGNGALIFSNAFVEWASSEAIRRARPRVLIACYGVRAKPKPFTGIAIFENQHRISALPDVDDPEGSAIDAMELTRYTWLAVERYREKEQTAFLCISEAARSAYVILPQAHRAALAITSHAAPEQIAGWMTEFLADPS